MKPTISRLLFSLATIGLISTASPAFAETLVGVVNTQKIMRDSKAAQSVRSQLQAKQKAFQAELDAKEKALLAEDQALAKQQASVEKAAFEQKVKDFRAKAATAQREIQTKKLQVDKALAGALENIQETTLQITKEVAAEKKITLVVSAAAVLYADSSLDITDEVLKRLNAKMPNVTVKF
jgi:Skp family chaperone for outer membrane proteins